MKFVAKKHPNHLADSCKHLSVNRMAAGSRLSRCNHGFFSSFQACFSQAVKDLTRSYRPSAFEL